MSVALVVVGDGRYEYLECCLESIRRHAVYPFSFYRIVDDSGTGDRVAPPSGWDLVAHPERRGLAAAVQSAWRELPADVEYVLHVEEDFLLTAPLDIDGMAATIKEHGRLAQLVLKRQPWSPAEQEAGGIMEMTPWEYVQRDGWVEHSRIFSLNPCLIPRAVIDLGWPDGNEAEMTSRLIADGWSFGFWGKREDTPRCLHIGARRSAQWKL